LKEEKGEMQDFVGFTYNGKHSIKDFGIYRTSDGSRYNDNLVPTMADVAAEAPGADGEYFFSTKHKNKPFSISIAFSNLKEEKYREMRGWLDGKDIHDLIFDEAPYKVYSAKVTGTPQLKTICFSDENGERAYKGEGSIQFTCYHPYAHTPEAHEVIKDDAKKPKSGEKIPVGIFVRKGETFKNTLGVKADFNYYNYKSCSYSKFVLSNEENKVFD
jgi:predicted phage tail component-like protein